MKKYKFLLFIIFFVSGINNLYANNTIAYLDMQKLMSQSIAGKNANMQIDAIHKKNINKFKETEKKLQDDEKNLISQKNILEKNEFKKKVEELRARANKYQKIKNEAIKKVNNQRINASKKLIDIINPILAEYSNNKSISFVIQKKYIILGKTELDITTDIIELLNKKVKKINFN